MEPYQTFKTIHFLGAALFIGYGLFAALWHGFILGRSPLAIRRFVLFRLFVMDVVASILITGLLMGGGFRMLKVMQVASFQFHWVWLGFMATVIGMFLLVLTAALTGWAWFQGRHGENEKAGSALAGWAFPLRLAYVVLPLFATVVMIAKPLAG